MTKRRLAMEKLLAVDPAQPKAPAKTGTPQVSVVRSGAVRTMGLALDQMREERTAPPAERVVDLDPALCDPSFVRDRLGETAGDTDPGGIEALATSIEEGGQAVPILVRPHPDACGPLPDRLRAPPLARLPVARPAGPRDRAAALGRGSRDRAGPREQRAPRPHLHRARPFRRRPRRPRTAAQDDRRRPRRRQVGARPPPRRRERPAAPALPRQSAPPPRPAAPAGSPSSNCAAALAPKPPSPPPKPQRTFPPTPASRPCSTPSPAIRHVFAPPAETGKGSFGAGEAGERPDGHHRRR